MKFLANNGISGFFVLSEVILCATGGEALYADMGHLGRKPIVRAWYFVFISLLLNYLGQGAFVLKHPDAKNVLFEMIFHQSAVLYIPFLVLSISRRTSRGVSGSLRYSMATWRLSMWRN
jgi:KUP system potassium uptake protein